MSDDNQALFISRKLLSEKIRRFTAGMAVTSGTFEIVVPGQLSDMEWNQMDQLHRTYVHRTYDRALRIVIAEDHAVSLTQWGRWPFLISVSDTRVAPGLFYQSMTLAGVVFLHSVIAFTVEGNQVRLRDDWYIASHRLFSFLHKPLNRRLLALHRRLNSEDAEIRERRRTLRLDGFRFSSDPPDFLTANNLSNHTLYPRLEGTMPISELPRDEFVRRRLGSIDFLLRREADDTVSIIPAACPHEGGPLERGRICDGRIECPWHGLQFRPAQLNVRTTSQTAFGFRFDLVAQGIRVSNVNTDVPVRELT